MVNLATSYMGLQLKNPIIVGSSGMTRTIENLIEAEKHGAGAVVLKSLFEEQIKFEIRKIFTFDEVRDSYSEAEDYIKNYSRNHTIEQYLDLISEAKKKLSIPVIASVNCMTANEWPSFAKKIEEAGADGLELNVFVLPSDFENDSADNEKMYFDIVNNVLSQVKIPVSLKISSYFSSLAQMVQKLSWTGVKGIVLFNRFYTPDIDVDKMKVVPSNIYSHPEEIAVSLRWVAILADRVNCDLAASTGIHDGKGIIKQLLVGAKAVQVCSTLYKNGFGQIDSMLSEIESWMQKHDYSSIDQFRGKMSHKKSDNPAAYQRVQFMKHFAGIE